MSAPELSIPATQNRRRIDIIRSLVIAAQRIIAGASHKIGFGIGGNLKYRPIKGFNRLLVKAILHELPPSFKPVLGGQFYIFRFIHLALFADCIIIQVHSGSTDMRYNE